MPSTMNLKLLLKHITCFTVLPLLPALVYAQAGVYDRVVGISYIRGNSYDFNFNDTYLFNAFDQVKPKPITAVVPFLLNVDQPDNFASTLNGLARRNITLIPAIGDINHNEIDDPYFKGLAQRYKKYTNYIRLELLKQYITTDNDIQHVQQMCDYLTSIGFEHIMLNPWPVVPGTHTFVKFSNAAVDSTILPVLLDENPDYTINRNPTNWYPPQPARVASIREAKPGASILVNYENQPQHIALSRLTENQQENAMAITIRQINQDNDGLHWTAPFSTNYNPVAEGTWNPFIVTNFERM